MGSQINQTAIPSIFEETKEQQDETGPDQRESPSSQAWTSEGDGHGLLQKLPFCGKQTNKLQFAYPENLLDADSKLVLDA
jgi:hypothetical protein